MFDCGDRVHHPRRREWGQGTVRKVEKITHAGTSAQRVTVDFPNKGRVVLNTAVAALEPSDTPRLLVPETVGSATGSSTLSPRNTPAPAIGRSREESTPLPAAVSQSTNGTFPDASGGGGGSGGGRGWLSSLGNQQEKHELWSLPDPCVDPFADLEKRLLATLETYRFSTEPRALLDWAVLQTGLDDPLTRYTRPELENAFPRFARDRDEHLRELVRDLKRKNERKLLDRIMSKTKLVAARDALKKAMRG